MNLLQEFSLVLPRSEVLTSNGGRGERYGHGKKVKNIVDKTGGMIHGLRSMDSTFVVVQVFRAANYRYDAANLHETVKPMMDAVVRHGLLEDDDNDHLIGPLPVHGGVDRDLSKKANPYLGERVRFRVLFFDDFYIREGLRNAVIAG